MRIKTIRRNVPITVEDVRGQWALETTGLIQQPYRVVVTIPQFSGNVAVGSRLMAASTEPVRAAADVAKDILAEAIERSRDDVLYVIINDFPAFAEGDHLDGLTCAAYDGRHEGGPRYVVRATSEEARRVLATIEGVGTIVDGDRSFTPSVETVTVNVLRAVEGKKWTSRDAATIIAAIRAGA